MVSFPLLEVNRGWMATDFIGAFGLRWEVQLGDIKVVFSLEILILYTCPGYLFKNELT